MVGRGLVVGAVAAVIALSACGESAPPAPDPAPVTASPFSPAPIPEQENNLRLLERLAELGCDTNSCIQTYFACKDGYLTGDPCEFYREHPM